MLAPLAEVNPGEKGIVTVPEGDPMNAVKLWAFPVMTGIIDAGNGHEACTGRGRHRCHGVKRLRRNGRD
jgi:hypothetical protein